MYNAIVCVPNDLTHLDAYLTHFCIANALS